MASQGFSLAVAVVSIAISANALMIGRATLSVLPEQSLRIRQPAEIVIGVAGLSVVMWLGCTAIGISAGKAFLACCGLGLAALAYNSRAQTAVQRWARTDLVILIAICVVSLVWCWQAIQAMPTLLATGRFPVWGDYNLQAIYIADFARLAVPPMALPFYHSASLMLPAALNALAHVPALICATALWTPLGFIIMGMGGYVLGTAVTAGRTGGIAAAAALLLVPDTAHYLRNGMFDFHWLEEISTGATYATGLSLAALALGVVAQRDHCGRALWLALGTSLGVIGLRSQIFLPLAVTEALLLIFLWRPTSRLAHIVGLITIALLMTSGALIAEFLPRGPHVFTDWPPDPMRFVKFALGFGPGIQANAFESLFAPLPLQIPVAIGLVYLLLISGGGMLAAVLVGFVWCGRRRLLLNERWFPMAAIAAFILIVMIVPPSITIESPLETQHSQFLFLYAVLAAWSGSLAGTWATARLGWRATCAVSAAASLLLPVPFLLSATAQSPAGAFMGWTAAYVGLTLPPGMIEAATFLREHSTPHDLVMATSNYQCGPLAALLERSTWFPERCEARSATSASTTPTRPASPGSIQAQMLDATNYENFIRPARERGIDWIFLYPITPPPAWIIGNSVWNGQNFFVLRVDSRLPKR